MKDQPSKLELANELIAASNISIRHTIQLISDKLSIPVILTDSLYYVQSYSNHLENIDKNERISVETLETNSFHNIVICNIEINKKTFTSLMCPVSYNQTTFGYLFFVDQVNEKNNDLYHLLQFVSMLFGMQLQKKQEIAEEKRKYKDAFLYDLLYGNMKLKEPIIEYGKILGWDLTTAHQILVFSLKKFNPFSTDQQILHHLHNRIENELENARKPIITLIKQNQVIVVFSLENAENTITSKKEVIHFVKNVQHLQEHVLENNSIICGIGNIYIDPTELFRSFQEAKIAYDLGILLDIDIPFFSDLGLERILYKHDFQELKEYYHNILGNLEAYDKTNDSHLTDTLKVFAENQFDITKTAQQLFLHRNTLRYRIKRIEEILNIKLDDFNTKLDIATAFKIKRLRNL